MGEAAVTQQEQTLYTNSYQLSPANDTQSSVPTNSQESYAFQERPEIERIEYIERAASPSRPYPVATVNSKKTKIDLPRLKREIKQILEKEPEYMDRSAMTLMDTQAVRVHNSSICRHEQ